MAVFQDLGTFAARPGTRGEGTQTHQENRFHGVYGHRFSFAARNLCRLVAAACVFSSLPRATSGKEPDWQVIKADGRDYLSLANIAQFYQLRGNPQFTDHHVTLSDGRARLELGLNPREIYVNGVKQWLLFPALVQNDQVLISRFDVAKTIEPSLRPTMIANLRPFRTVVLDAGHGGKDIGASSRVGTEKNYTLDVCQHLKRSLEARGVCVVMTRGDDSFLGLEDRADAANTAGDTVFVSLHFNSSADGGQAKGFEVYALTPQGATSTDDRAASLEQFEGAPGNEFDEASLALATCVQSSLLGRLPQTDRGVRRARFAVLRFTRAPAILIEGGYLTNERESLVINDPIWRERLAEAIAQGVESFQGVACNRRPPRTLADYRNEQLPLLGKITNPANLASRNLPGGTATFVPMADPVAAREATELVRSGGGIPAPN